MISETIPPALAGERLDRVVAMILGVTRSVAATLVSGGGAQVDGAVITVGKQRLVEGQMVTVDPALIPVDEAPAGDPDVHFGVVYEDADIVVIDKPAGLVVHPGAGNADGTLVNGLLARYPEIAAVGEEFRPGIVHRLDAGTTGLLVVARTPEAYSTLVGMLSTHQVERIYRTVVWGRPDNVNGVIDAPIGRDQRDPQRMAVSVDGRLARTHYHLTQVYDRPVLAAALTCRLETGRTHQIRVHLAAIGHPVVGDPTYGGVRPGIDAPRPMLHAAELAFDHPITGERVSFTSPLPADFESVLATLTAHTPD